jgi:hypothetical protein
MSEPWNTVLFLVAIPLIVQILKVIRDRRGVPLSRLAKQGLALGLSFAFTTLSGGFSVFDIPALPVWGGDIVTFVTDALGFASGLIVVAGGAWVVVTGLYETVLDRLMSGLGLSTS